MGDLDSLDGTTRLSDSVSPIDTVFLLSLALASELTLASETLERLSSLGVLPHGHDATMAGLQDVDLPLSIDPVRMEISKLEDERISLILEIQNHDRLSNDLSSIILQYQSVLLEIIDSLKSRSLQNSSGLAQSNLSTIIKILNHNIMSMQSHASSIKNELYHASKRFDESLAS